MAESTIELFRLTSPVGLPASQWLERGRDVDEDAGPSKARIYKMRKPEVRQWKPRGMRVRTKVKAGGMNGMNHARRPHELA